MGISLLALFLLATPSPNRAQTSEKSSCISCHLEEGDELAEPVKGMEEDVHTEAGLDCVDCHGGDPDAGRDGEPDAAMDPDKGYLGAPERRYIPQFCARCHSSPDFMRQFNPRVATDQLDRYKTSVHGKLLAKGDEHVATCVDCHGVHGIRHAKDARSLVYPANVPRTCGRCHADPQYMAKYDIPNDQFDQYSKSVHGVALLEKGDLAAPACNDCHGNHGASPPGAPSIAFICGQCHLNNSELFFKSPHRAAFEENDLPECETCHGYHGIQHPSDDMLGTGEASVCMECHEEGSRAYAVSVAMYSRIDTLKRIIHRADSLVAKAERAGMPVGEALFQLKDANDALVKSRTRIHSLDAVQIEEVASEGRHLATKAFEAGLAALAELQFRRRGLAISLIFILAFALGLYLKIKEIETRGPAQQERVWH